MSDEMTQEIEAAVGELELEEVGAITEEKEEVIDDREVDVSTGTAETTEAEVTEKETTETTEVPEETSTEEIPAEEIQELSDELLERAVDAGIPVADARGLPIESLERVVKGREREFAEDTRRRAAQDTPPVKEGVADPFADMPELDPDVHDAATIAMFEKLKGIAQQQQETIKSYGTRQEEAERATAAKDRRDTTQWFDKQVSGLGENFVETLGTGGYDSLDQGSSQYEKRDAIANQMTVMLAGYNAIGQEAPPREEVFDTAARLVLHDEYQQIREKELSGDLAKRATQHIQRAGGQKATGKETPMEEAARMLDEKYPS